MNLKLCNLLYFVLIFDQVRSNQETSNDDAILNATIGVQGDSTEIPLINDQDHHIDFETDNFGNNSQQDYTLEGLSKKSQALLPYWFNNKVFFN